MDDMRRSAIKALGWVGLWLGWFLFIPSITLWLQFFHLHRGVSLLPMDNPLFWPVMGVYALLATVICLERWQRGKSPAAEQKPEATGAKLLLTGMRVVLVAFFAYFIVRLAIDSRGTNPDWPGVIGSAAALIGLFAVIRFCEKLVSPDPEPLKPESGGSKN